MKPADYLTYYATKFHTVEVDSTFHRTPSVATVNGWARKVPEGFLLAAKVPQVITHEKILRDCETDLESFLETMDLMGNKLGPLLFQFGYFAGWADLAEEADTAMRARTGAQGHIKGTATASLESQAGGAHPGHQLSRAVV